MQVTFYGTVVTIGAANRTGDCLGDKSENGWDFHKETQRDSRLQVAYENEYTRK
jgi:hypothetical protein